VKRWFLVVMAIAVLVVTSTGCFLNRADDAELAVLKKNLEQYAPACTSVIQSMIDGRTRVVEGVASITMLIRNQVKDEQRKLQLEELRAQNMKNALRIGFEIVLALVAAATGYFPTNSKLKTALSIGGKLKEAFTITSKVADLVPAPQKEAAFVGELANAAILNRADLKALRDKVRTEEK